MLRISWRIYEEEDDRLTPWILYADVVYKSFLWVADNNLPISARVGEACPPSQRIMFRLRSSRESLSNRVVRILQIHTAFAMCDSSENSKRKCLMPFVAANNLPHCICSNLVMFSTNPLMPHLHLYHSPDIFHTLQPQVLDQHNLCPS